jgi:beta-ureidopropionase / N-carbamoyl-L-amino-acid hydrolase
MKINSQRLLQNINRYAQIGKVGEIGVERITLSDEDKEARDLFKSQMIEVGLEVSVDEIGNMIGVRKGTLDVPPVAIGSHLDTVYQGGRFDGALGVLAGLELIQILNDNNIETQKPIALINFTNEEGVNYAPDMMGSHAFAKLGDLETILKSHAYDNENQTVDSELKRIGYKSDLKCGEFALDSFLELHIEQGPILEKEKVDIGAVEMVQGIYWTRYTIHGQANHAGTTPIELRSDAGYAAAQTMKFIGDLSRVEGSGLLTTVGTVQFKPNAINIVPSSASFTLDARSVDLEVLRIAQQQIDEFMNGLIAESDLKLDKEEMVRFSPVQFDESIVNLVENSAKDLNLSIKRMPSGAGHDAQMMAAVCPTAMVFVPSVNGISHNVQELTLDADVENGANVLLNTCLSLANR